MGIEEDPQSSLKDANNFTQPKRTSHNPGSVTEALGGVDI